MKMPLKNLILAFVAILFTFSPADAQSIRPQGKRDIPTEETQIIPRKQWRAARQTKEVLPESVDNSKLKYFPPIISQIGGSCAQASTIGYMCTYELNRLLDRPANSKGNRLSYLFTWNFINGGIDEGSLGWDGLSLASNCGLMSEEDFPSQSSAHQFKWASGYDKYFRALHNRVKNFNDIDVTTMDGIQQVKQYLYNKNEPGQPGGIVIFSSMAVGWKFDDYYTGPSQTGYKSLLTKLATDGPHGMTIVGYDDLVEFTAPDGQMHKGAFIVANTHGSWRHDNGRFYLPYWFFLQPRDINDLSHTVTGADLEYRKPQIVFKVDFEYSSRNDLSFKTGVSGHPADTRPKHDYFCDIFYNQGGEHPMQGSYGDPHMEVAFDFSQHVEKMKDLKEPNFFLTINRQKRGDVYGEGKLYSISVYDYRKDYEHPEIYTKDLGGIEIPYGTSVYSLPTTEIPKTSRSSLEWLNIYGRPIAAPFVIRTAKGKYAKVRLSDYDKENGTIKIKYVYNPNKNRKLK